MSNNNNTLLNSGNLRDMSDYHQFIEDTSELHYYMYKNEELLADSSYQDICNNTSEIHYIFDLKKILASLRECNNFYFIPNGELLKESSTASENYEINVEQADLPPIPQVVLDEIVNFNVAQKSLEKSQILELENKIENLEFFSNLTNNPIEKIIIESKIEKLEIQIENLHDLYDVPTINFIDNICGSNIYSVRYDYFDAISKITEIIMSYF